jgi:flagellar biogenesis protein FliO
MGEGVSVMGSLLPSLALFVGGPILIWWLRRKRPGSLSGLRVSARTALTRNSVVAIVETGDRRFLLGATDHSVEVIAELDPSSEEPNTEELQGLEVPEGPRTSPLETLRAMTVRRAGNPRSFHAHRS